MERATQKFQPGGTVMWRDVLLAVRGFGQRPLRTLSLIGCLSLAFAGISTVVMAKAALTRYATDYPAAENIVVLWEDHSQRQLGLTPTSVPNYRDLVTSTTSFSDVGAFTDTTFTLGGDGNPERVDGVNTTSSALQVAGVSPVLGRSLLPADDVAGAERVVVLGHALWRRRFAADERVLGRAILLNNVPHTVVGVMPERFTFPPAFRTTAGGAEVVIPESELWVPYEASPADTRRDIRFLLMVARLHPGRTLAEAQADLNVVGAQLASANPKENLGMGLTAFSLLDQVLGPTRSAVNLLTLAAIVVSVIAIVNAAILMLAGVSHTLDGSAVRLALGATKAHVYVTYVIQAMLASFSAVLIGLPLTFAGAQALLAYLSPHMPRVPAVVPDVGLFGIALAVMGGSGLGMGLLAGRLAASAPPRMLFDGGGVRSSRGHAAALRGLLALQVVVGTFAVCGTAVLLETSRRLHAIDPGFRTDGLVVLKMALPGGAYAGPRIASLQRDILQGLRSYGGITAAASVDHVPLGDSTAIVNLTVESDARPVEGRERPRATLRTVSADYFEMLSIAPTSGRLLSASDDVSTPPVVVVNQRFADVYWSGLNPVGQRIKRGTPENPWITVVGIVPATNSGGIRQEPSAEIYLPYAQSTRQTAISFIVQPKSRAESTIRELQELIRGFDPSLPMAEVQHYDALADRSLGNPTQHALLLAAVSSISLVVVVLGLYALTSGAIAFRLQEFAIRMCLGATPGALALRVGAETIVVLTIAAVTGAIGAMLMLRMWPAAFPNITTPGAMAFVAAAGFMILVGSAAIAMATREISATSGNLLYLHPTDDRRRRGAGGSAALRERHDDVAGLSTQRR